MTQEIQNEIKEEIGAVQKYISIDDFLKVEIRLGTIVTAEIVEGSDKLYRLTVDFGEYSEVESETGVTEREERLRTVFSGIRKYVSIEDLIGAQYPFVTNLEPRKIMGSYSEAMILAGSQGDTLALMRPTARLDNGTVLK